MTSISVLLPVYNGERYLSDTIESILSQSYSNFEFLIVDDGSTDGTLDIICSFDDKRIRVLQNPKRLKLSGALNRGIKEAKGQYIARMDADDIALPGRLAAQVQFMDANPKIGVCGTAIEIFGTERPRRDIYPAKTEDIRSYALFDCPFCHPTVMMRSDLLKKYSLLYDGSFYPTEDYELWARAVQLFPTENLGEVLLRYRVHGASMTGADWNDMDKQATRVARPLVEKLVPEVTDEQMQMHRNIGRGRSCRLNNLTEINQAEFWLQRLKRVNKTTGIYDSAALAKVISLVWYRLCMNSSTLGFGVYAKYAGSSLKGKIDNDAHPALTLLLSILKNIMLKRGR